MPKHTQTDFLIVGAGIAGLNLAIKLSQKGSVTLITKTKLQESNSHYAQGGIAAVITPEDSFQEHINDTLKAGSFHNNKQAVELMVKNSPQAIKDLINFGVQFDKELAQEGGHSHRRISFVGDYTGQEIINKLIQKTKSTPNITILEHHFATDLITQNNQCFGTHLFHNNQITQIFSPNTILATGGLGQIYNKTTNPLIATADGLAIAIRAGAKTADLEFIQFHPTALDHGQSPLFLISEALRGEGAILLNEKNQAFIDPLKPRDQVAQAIHLQKKSYLKITKPKPYLQKRFPHIYQKLQSINIKMETDLIPITPAAHYSCGGITTNLLGETSIKNLHACGEVAHTGVHGANRLASNSLLEALVFSNQIAQNLQKQKTTTIQTPNYKPQTLSNSHRKTIQNLMSKRCNISRTHKNLLKLKNELQLKAHSPSELTIENLETANILIAAKAITNAALNRKQSLGCHQINNDHTHKSSRRTTTS